MGVLKMSIVMGFSFLELFLIFTEDSFKIREIENNFYTVWEGNILIFSSLMMLIFIIFLVYWMIITINHLPNEIRYIKKSLSSAILMMGPLSLTLFILSSYMRFFIIISDSALM